MNLPLHSKTMCRLPFAPLASCLLLGCYTSAINTPCPNDAAAGDSDVQADGVQVEPSAESVPFASPPHVLVGPPDSRSFGYYLALSRDGGRLAVADPSLGRVQTFDRLSGTWGFATEPRGTTDPRDFVLSLIEDDLFVVERSEATDPSTLLVFDSASRLTFSREIGVWSHNWLGAEAAFSVTPNGFFVGIAHDGQRRVSVVSASGLTDIGIDFAAATNVTAAGDSPETFAIAREGRWIATASGERIRHFGTDNVGAWQEYDGLRSPDGSRFDRLRISNDGLTVAASTDRHSVIMFSLGDGLRAQVLACGPRPMIALSGDGDTLVATCASADYGREVRVFAFDNNQWTLVRVLPRPEGFGRSFGPYALALAADGQTIATSGGDSNGGAVAIYTR